MSDKQNIYDYGQQFKTEIEQALINGDFSGLKQLVSDTVDMAVSGAADQVTRAASFISGQAGASGQDAREQFHSHAQRQHGSQADVHQERQSTRTYGKYDFRTDRTAARNSPRAVRSQGLNTNQTGMAAGEMPVAERQALLKKTGNVSGTLFQVFGGIGTGVCGVTTLVFLIISIFLQIGPMRVMAIIFFLLTIGSLIMLGSGNKIKARLYRAQRYFELCKKSGYMNISQIAEQMGRRDKTVVKDLQRLIENGTFPQGHLDRGQKCFMLTDSAYEEYQRVDRQRQQFALENREADLVKTTGSNKDEPAGAAHAEDTLTEEQRQLKAMIAEGQEYIRQIRRKNDAIPGEVITCKLHRMEALLEEIFVNLEKMPKQMTKMKRLMQYYLPTTLKLVTAYEQFDRMSVQGEDILSAKKEIEDTIDTINDAFGELLNKLFADTAMDVTTDAQVLKTMLVKEGLVEGEFEHVR